MINNTNSGQSYQNVKLDLEQDPILDPKLDGLVVDTSNSVNYLLTKNTSNFGDFEYKNLKNHHELDSGDLILVLKAISKVGKMKIKPKNDSEIDKIMIGEVMPETIFNYLKDYILTKINPASPEFFPKNGEITIKQLNALIWKKYFNDFNKIFLEQSKLENENKSNIRFIDYGTWENIDKIRYTAHLIAGKMEDAQWLLKNGEIESLIQKYGYSN